MMEDRIKNLERKRQEQNYQLNILMEYQLNQNRLNKSKSAILIPVINAQSQPNMLLLTSENNNIKSLDYQKNILPYYNNHKQFYTQKKHNSYYYHKSNLKNENLVRDMIKNNKIDKAINDNLENKVYLPIKNDINNYRNKINYNIQRKIESNNNIVNHNINIAQKNYGEMKNLFQNKINKIELKQKMLFENLKNELEKTVKNIQKNPSSAVRLW